MTKLDMSSVNLDAPAFPSKVVEEETATTEPSQAESGKEEKETEAPSEATESEVEEQRVPYSRLKSQIEARREAEERAVIAEENYQRILSERRPVEHADTNDGELPNYWLKMYGDSEQSQEAYKYELERQRTIREEARREAIEAVRQERSQENQIISQNERTIDNRLEDLSESLGRPLTEREEATLLDIVDEYTPIGEDGNYSGDLIPMEKAWEIYKLQQSVSGNKSKKARETPTALTSQKTEGETDTTEKDNAAWNPRDWNSWRKRIPQN